MLFWHFMDLMSNWSLIKNVTKKCLQINGFVNKMNMLVECLLQSTCFTKAWIITVFRKGPRFGFSHNLRMLICYASRFEWHFSPRPKQTELQGEIPQTSFELVQTGVVWMHPKLHVQISLKRYHCANANTVLIKAKVKVKAGNNQQTCTKWTRRFG